MGKKLNLYVPHPSEPKFAHLVSLIYFKSLYFLLTFYEYGNYFNIDKDQKRHFFFLFFLDRSAIRNNEIFSSQTS